MAMMLIMVTGLAFMLISKLDINRIDREDINDTYRSLERAKQALIGYALTTPERSTASPRPGPGYLPCPDFDNDGDADPACGPNSIGRLPYETLEEERLLDDSGEVLWYVLADNYRFNPAVFTPLNSETAGLNTLTLDGQPNVVAVVFAPGPAFPNQQRNAGPNVVGNYLENDNSDGDTGFISGLINDEPPTHNDRVIAITSQELMAAVEKRVLGEVDRVLDAYRNNHGVGNEAFPWLVPFGDPTQLNHFDGSVPGTTSAGHLPVRFADAPSLPQPAANLATLSTSWNIGPASGVFTPSPSGTPSEDCVRNSDCIDPNIAPPDPLVFDNASCNWTTPDIFQCTGTITVSQSTDILGLITETYTRTYQVTVDHTVAPADLDTVTTSPDTAAQLRTRNLVTNGITTLVGATPMSIVVTDDRQLAPPLLFGFWITCDILPPCGVLGTAQLDLADGDPVTSLTLSGIDYPLDAVGLDRDGDGNFFSPGVDNSGDGDFNDPGDVLPDIPRLPPWLVNNNWHHLIYVAYPDLTVEPLPGSAATTCTVGVDCLTLTANGMPVNNNIRALVITAGGDLTGSRPSNLINDYFEGIVDVLPQDGIDDDNVFTRQQPSNVFNDQLRVILP